MVPLDARYLNYDSMFKIFSAKCTDLGSVWGDLWRLTDGREGVVIDFSKMVTGGKTQEFYYESIIQVDDHDHRTGWIFFSADEDNRSSLVIWND